MKESELQGSDLEPSNPHAEQCCLSICSFIQFVHLLYYSVNQNLKALALYYIWHTQVFEGQKCNKRCHIKALGKEDFFPEK